MTYKVNIIESAGSGPLPSFSSIDALSWAKRVVAQRTTVSNNIPLYYREVLRYLISELGNLAYIDSELNVVKVKCVHSNPERTIAKLKQENNIILPIIAINQNTSDNADKRRRTSNQIINESFWSKKKKRAFRILSVAPRPVDIQYGINIWAKYKANLDQLVEQIRLLFNPSLTISTAYSNSSVAFIEQESDNSTVEVSDRKDRIIRRTFLVKFETYIPNPKFLITSTGEIEEFNTDTTIY